MKEGAGVDGLKLYKQYLENIRVSISNYKLPEIKGNNIVSIIDRTREIEDLSYIDVVLKNANVSISFLGDKSFMNKEVCIASKLPSYFLGTNEEENRYIESLIEDLDSIEIDENSEGITFADSSDYCSIDEVIEKYSDSLASLFGQLEGIQKIENEHEERKRAFFKALEEEEIEKEINRIPYVEDEYDDDEDDEDDDSNDDLKDNLDDDSDDSLDDDSDDDSEDNLDDDSDDSLDDDSDDDSEDNLDDDLDDNLDDDLDDNLDGDLDDDLEDDFDEILPRDVLTSDKSYESFKFEDFTEEDLESRSVLSDLWKKHFNISEDNMEEEILDTEIDVKDVENKEDVETNFNDIDSLDVSSDIVNDIESDTFSSDRVGKHVEDEVYIPTVSLGKSLLEDDDLDTGFLFDDEDNGVEEEKPKVFLSKKEDLDEEEPDDEEDIESDFDDIFGNNKKKSIPVSKRVDNRKSREVEYEDDFKKKNFDTFLDEEEDITGKLLSEELEDDEDRLLRDTDPPDRSMFQEATDYFINGDRYKNNEIRELYRSKEKIVDSDDFTGLDDMLAKAILAVSDNLWTLPRLLIKGKGKKNSRKFYESMIVEEDDEEDEQ